MELKNEGHEPFTLEPGSRIAQMVLYGGLPVDKPYRFKGRYHGQRAVTGARAAGVSKTLDASPMWVAGPFNGTPTRTYATWRCKIEAAIKEHPELGTLDTTGLPSTPVATNGSGDFLTLDEMECEHIKAALTATNGHRGRACQLLGISRPTLVRKVRKFGLEKFGESVSALPAPAASH
jgi:hypothetical protein